MGKEPACGANMSEILLNQFFDTLLVEHEQLKRELKAALQSLEVVEDESHRGTQRRAELCAENGELKAKLAAAEADTVRLDLLAMKGWSLNCHHYTSGYRWEVWNRGHINQITTNPDFRKAIDDAARKEGKPCCTDIAM